MKKTTIMIMALALSAAIAGAQDKPAAKPAASEGTPAAAQQASDDPIIVAAGDVSIRRSEFENAIKTLPAEYQQFAQGPGKKQFAEDYLRMKMLAAQGFKDNLQNDAEVQQQLNLMRENLVANAELKKMEQGIQLGDADLQKMYDENKKEYEQVKARHILIAFKGSPAAQAGKDLTEDQAKAKAEELKKKIQAGGSFEEIAKAESDDKGSAARGGDLGPFSHGQMVEEFEKAAFEAKAGEVIGPVRTQYGFHLIKVDSHEITPFDKVKDTLAKRERQRRLQESLDAMKKTANPTFNEAYFTPPAPKMEAAPAPPAEKKPAAETKKSAPATKKSGKKQ